MLEDFTSFKLTFNIDTKLARITELENMSSAPNFWENQKIAQSLMRELSDLKNDIAEVKDLEEEVKIFSELGIGEEGRITKRLEKLKLKTYLSDTYDKKNAIVSIHAGQGGTEAMDWVSILFRMYLRFVERREWKAEVLDQTAGEEAGIKSVTFKIIGNYAYGYTKNEAGTHRLVRQSPFNADNLRQTSFAMVEVLPEIEDIDLPDIQLKDEDLDIQFYRAGGHGGQNVNKVSTAVRLTHIPTGIVVTAQTERFQEQNKRNAMDLLRAKLWLREKEMAKEHKKELKGDFKPASWGTQIRSYVLHPYKMIKDLRTEVETSNTEVVLDGDLEQFIDAELKLSKS